MLENTALENKELREEIARLSALINQQKNTIQHQKFSIENLQHQLQLFRTARFGRKSEKGVVGEQLALQFDEIQPLEEVESTPTVDDKQTITYTKQKRNRSKVITQIITLHRKNSRSNR